MTDYSNMTVAELRAISDAMDAKRRDIINHMKKADGDEYGQLVKEFGEAGWRGTTARLEIRRREAEGNGLHRNDG